MKNINHKNTVIFWLLLLPAFVKADSPLTSTPFHDAYIDEDIVLKAEQTNVMTKDFAEFLHSKIYATDLKAALINAIGWNLNGMNNSEEYCRIIFNKKTDELKLEDLSSEDLFVIGYLKAMENYFEPEKAEKYLREARKRMKKSFTVAVIYALFKSQIAMENDFCRVWKIVDKVFRNKNLKQDMRESAKKIIYDYIVVYKEYCN